MAQFESHRNQFIGPQQGLEEAKSSSLSDAIGSDRPIVDVARNPIIVRAGFSQVRFQKVEGLIAQVEAGRDAALRIVRTGGKDDPG
jgi:hypothetical protein